MNASRPIHVVRRGPVTATVHRLAGFVPEYRVTVAFAAASGAIECGLDDLRPAREALEQAEHFIRYEQQLARMNPCPGCGDG